MEYKIGEYVAYLNGYKGWTVGKIMSIDEEELLIRLGSGGICRLMDMDLSIVRKVDTCDLKRLQVRVKYDETYDAARVILDDAEGNIWVDFYPNLPDIDISDPRSIVINYCAATAKAFAMLEKFVEE